MKKFLPIVLIVFLFLPLLIFAQQGLVPCGEAGNPCKLCHLFQLVNNILNWVLFVIIPIIAPIFIVIGGIYLLIARGDPGMFSKGKSVLTATVIGLIIVYTAYVLLSTVLTSLGVANWTGLGSWWQIACPI
ncbi:hypothetical protein IH982_02780 [Patescibacteria group bacterium]|nr:hypothetical protein [Patescibacteria group bacterium]